MENPFIEIGQRLNTIESLLKDLQIGIAQPATESRRIPVGIDRIAEITRLAKPTIYGKVSAKEIPHFKQGKKLLFFEDEIIEWIRQGKRKTLSEIEAEADAHIERRRARKS